MVHYLFHRDQIRRKKFMAKKADNLAFNWWALTLRGVAAIMFGVAAVFWPGLTLVTLVYLVSAFVLFAGVINIIEGALSIGKHRAWALTMVLGLVQAGVGLYLVRHPKVTFATFILVVGLMFVARGIFEVVVALAEDGVTASSRVLTIIAGIAGFLVGIYLLFQPVSGGVAFVWVLGLYALITGPLMIALSLDVKKSLEQ
jgi:uncharacterized membrane protein HdeD (DUF308 family)